MCQPAAGFAIDREIHNHAFVYLPCHYDKPEVVIKPAGKDDCFHQERTEYRGRDEGSNRTVDRVAYAAVLRNGRDVPLAATAD